MKVGFDARFIKETGVGRYIQNILPLMISRDKNIFWSITVLPEHKKFLLSIISSQDKKRVKIITTKTKWHSFKEQFSIPYIFYKEKVDVLHIPYINVPVLYFKRLVTTIHDLTILTHRTGRASTHNMLIYNIKRLGFKIALYRALMGYRILLVSSTVKDEISSRFRLLNKNKLLVTPNGFSKLPSPKTKAEINEIDNFFKENKISKYRPYFFYVGNIHPHKNVEFTVDVLNKYFDKKPNYTFVIAGRDDFFMKRLKDKVSRLKNKDNFAFFANPTDGQLNLLYRGSKFVLLPSLKEGFGLQILEAMSLNTLILCSQIPAYKEVGSEYCSYYNSISSRSLIMSLDKMFKHNKVSKDRLTCKYAKNLKRYSWSETAKNTLEVYRGGRKKRSKVLKVLPGIYK